GCIQWRWRRSRRAEISQAYIPSRILTKMVWHVQVAADTTKSVKLQLFWAEQPQADVRFNRVDAREHRVPGVIPHTYAIGPSVQCDGTEGSTMYLIYGLLVLAM